MQDEVNEKVVALSIKTGKLTAEVLQKAMKALLANDMPPLCHRVGKLPSDLMRRFVIYFPRLKGLYQMMGEVVSLVYRLRQGKAELYIRRFIGAAKRGHQHFPVRLVRVFDVGKGFVQRSLNRLNLCNRHIAASTPLISSMSSW